MGGGGGVMARQIEKKKETKTILAVVTNRAPNKRVPDMAVKLAQSFHANVHLLYIVSSPDIPYSLPLHGASQEQINGSEEFLRNFEKRYGTEITIVKKEGAVGDIVKTVLKKCETIDPFLIVLGRVAEKEIMLTLKRGIKHHLARKTSHNLLLVK